MNVNDYIVPENKSPYEPYIYFKSLSDTWPNTSDLNYLTLVCGFQSAELCLRLISDVHDDDREYINRSNKISRYVEHIQSSLEFVGSWGANSAAVPANLWEQNCSTASPGLKSVHRCETAVIEQITDAYSRVSDRLGFAIGLEKQAGNLRTLAGLESKATGRFETNLHYGTAISAEQLHKLKPEPAFGPEDSLFCTAHQISECWLRIAHSALRAAALYATEGLFADASKAISCCCQALHHAENAGNLLNLMTLADYHPLRVGLRDGSGAQSAAAQGIFSAAQQAAQPLWTALANRNLKTVDVLRYPDRYTDLLYYMNSLKDLSDSIQKFLFNHYLMVIGVLGAKSVGSLGYDIGLLADRAAMPVFSRLNENLYDFSMITNLKYGSHSGKIIMDRMPPYKFVKNSTHHECDLYHMQSIVEKYFKFIESRREKEWVSLFCPNLGCMQDGLDVKPFIGSSKLSIFFNSVMRNFESMRADYKIVKQTGKNSLLVEWRFETRSYHGYDATFSGMEHFWFSSNGRILKAEASWKPHEVAEQWERQEGSMLGAEQTQSNANMAATATA